MSEEWDVIVIGGGAAGLSAAQMLGRSRRRVLVIDAGLPRNHSAAHMHGVLGHDGKPPQELLEAGRAEARAYGVALADGRVTSLADEGERIRVHREDSSDDSARAIIIASGIRDELPAVPGLAEQWGRTVLHCPYCHGWEVAGRSLGVLATSAASLHQTELVRQLSDDVTVFGTTADQVGDDAAERLMARGVRIAHGAVTAVSPVANGLEVSTDDGRTQVVTALFTAGSPVVELGFAEGLALQRADLPGSPLAVDLVGATSHGRVFAAGNATAPWANVPVSMGAGSMAGAAANAMLVAEDFDRAVADRAQQRRDGWEARYAAEDRFWSGRVNATMAAVAATLTPGSALDIGSGEGGDVVWLAEHGWRAVGVDVSATAVRRAAELATERGVDVDFVVGDGAEAVEGEFDLVLASFLHSWEPDFPRIRLLRDAAARVTAGGRLLVVSHAAPPPWARELPDHMPVMRTPPEELAMLGLDPSRWQPEIVEVRRRSATAPDGTPAHLDDGVILLRRSA
jgi:thioredoxin reductase/SAM-dependent methyltransferase